MIKFIESLLQPAKRKDLASVIAVVAFAAIEGIAIFNDGGYFISTMALCAIGAWLIFIFLLLATNEKRHISFAWISYVTIALFALFWLWNGVSIFWSISTDLSWVEFIRTGGYLALLLIGVAVGNHNNARSLAAGSFLFIAVAAAIYTIGAKALPSVIDNYGDFARVYVPLGYTNATGLMSAIAFPIAVYFSAERSISSPMRLLSGGSAMLLLTSLFFTMSRGAIFALILGLTLYFAFCPIRIRSLVMLSIVLVPTLLIAFWSAGQSAIMENRVDRFLRIETAVLLRWYLALGILFIFLSTLFVIYIDKKITFTERTVRIAGICSFALVAIALTSSATYFVMTREPSLKEWAANTYSDFKSIPEGSSKSRITRLSAVGSSSGRWQLWQEAIQSWQEKPVQGSGAQSFPLTHLLTREPETGNVKQPHGLYFRLLSELGLVGLLFFAAFMSLSIGVATMLIIKLQDRKLKGLAAAIFSLTIIYLVHTSYDWDWNMFAVTMPYFLFTGILIGWHDSLFGRPTPSIASGNAELREETASESGKVAQEA